MKVLIVGSSSVVGLAAGRLLAQKHDVAYAGRRDAHYFLDLASPNCALPGNLQFDAVIHAAADFGGASEEDILRAEITNAIGTINVCRLARQARAQHVIVISSTSAACQFGEPHFNAYSLSKRHGDELAMLYCDRFDLPWTILRPTQIYDAESRCKKHQKLFFLIIERALKGDDIVFHGNNDALRNYIFLDDLAEIISRVIETKLTGLYYCSAKESTRLSEIAKIAYCVFNTAGRVIFDDQNPPIPDVNFFSGEALYQALRFEPAVSLKDGVKKIRQIREQL